MVLACAAFSTICAMIIGAEDFFFSFPRTLVTPVKVRNELYHRSEDLDFVRHSLGKSGVTLSSGASRLILSSSEV